MDIKRIDFGNLDESGRHKCDSVKKGDWIIWTCPDCEDYERRLNWVTGEMKVNSGNSMALHIGNHLPNGVNPGLLNSN